MYAVIRTGGKQYRVTPDQELQIEKIDAAEGERIEFSNVLMIGHEGELAEIGAPVVEGARVAAEVVEQGRGDKIIVFKKKRRKNYRRKNGHRQHLTTIRVLEVLGAGDKPKKKKGATAAATKTEPGEGLDSKPKKGAKPGDKTATPAEGKSESAKTRTPPRDKASGFQKLDAPQGEPDNLKSLPGVGPKMVEKLNEYGIFHFHQLAAMSDEDINEMDAALDLRGRATRDDWVGQAKQMIED